MSRPEAAAMSGLPLPEPVADEDDDGLQDRAALLTYGRPRPGRRRPRPRAHTAAGRCLPLVKTLTICLAFFTLGLCIALPGPTLLDLQDQVSVSLSQISQIFFWRALGYLGGSMISGLLFDRLNRLLMMLASMALAAAGMATVPWLSSALSLNVCFAALGVPLGFVDTCGNVLLLDLWGKSSGPYMQAIHFSFGLGAFTAPLLAVPFITHTPPVNGTATVLLGRNHLHTVQLPADRPDNQTEPPSEEEIAGMIDVVTRPPVMAVSRRSSGSGDDAEVAQFVKLGVALAGGNAAVRHPRAAARGVDSGTGPETVQGLEREEVTEEHKSSVGRKGVVFGDAGGRVRGGSMDVGRVETEVTALPATEQAMAGGENVEAKTPAVDGGQETVQVTVAPAVGTAENWSVATEVTDYSVPLMGTAIVLHPVEDGSLVPKVALSTTPSSETMVKLPFGNLTDGVDLTKASQNKSEEILYDVMSSGNLNFTESPPDVTTVGNSSTSSEPTGVPPLQHTPKPKPLFTDGNKLEHDQTWKRPPFKPSAQHPAPAAEHHPDSAALPSTAAPDTTEGSSTAQTNSSAPTDVTPASDSGGVTTPAPLAGSEASDGVGATGTGDKETEEAVEGVQAKNSTEIDPGPVGAVSNATEGGQGSGEETSDPATASGASDGAGDSVSSDEQASTSSETQVDNELPTLAPKSSTKANHINDGSVLTLASKQRIASEPTPVASPVSNDAIPPVSEHPAPDPETTEPPAPELVTGSDPSAPPTTTGSPADVSSRPETVGADSSAPDRTAEAAGTTAAPPPSGADPEIGSESGMGLGQEDGASRWEPEEPAGTEPGLSVPAVPPTVAIPATSPGVLGAAPAPTASQGSVESGPGRSEGDEGVLPSTSSPVVVSDSPDQPIQQPDSSEPSALTPESPASTPSPSQLPPKPHKPGTYDDTSAEDDLLTRLSSAAAVHGVPPLAQLYLLVSCSLLLVALIFLALLLYDPRARRAAPSSDSGAGPSRCYTGTLVSLMAVVLCFYVGMEVAMGQLLMSFSVHAKVHLSRAGGAYVTSVFWGLFATGRALSVCVAGVLRPAAVLAIDYALVTAGAAVLLAAGSWNRTALLVGGALSGLGMASVFPAALVWLEQHVHVSSRLAAVLVVAGATGEMLLPAGVGALMALEPRALTYSLAACTAVSLLTQAAAVAAARLGRPAVGPLEGYQLAAQEEEEDMVDLAKYPGSGEEGSRRLLRM